MGGRGGSLGGRGAFKTDQRSSRKAPLVRNDRRGAQIDHASLASEDVGHFWSPSTEGAHHASQVVPYVGCERTFHQLGPTRAEKLPPARRLPSESISSGNCGRGRPAGP